MQTFTGLQYLMIDIATTFGLGKKTWDERLAWAEENEPEFESLAKDAKEPMLYLAGVNALRKTQKGEPTGYAISLDATSSGLQLLACLTECRQSASLCNVLDTGDREDAYIRIYQEICRRAGDDLEVTQEQAKQAVMTALYGSILEPMKVFGDGPLLTLFYKVLEDLAPGAWNLNLALQGLWKPYATEHSWVMPDNFHVHCKVTQTQETTVECFGVPTPVRQKVVKGTKEGRSLGPNVIHSVDGMIVREITRRCSIDFNVKENIRVMAAMANRGVAHRRGSDREQDIMAELLWTHYQRSGFLSARILDYLDDANFGIVDASRILDLIDSLPQAAFPIMSIHDCFRVHPNHANDLRQQYNNLLAEIAESDLLSYLASQIAGQPIPVTKRSTISQDIRSADYAIC